MKRLFTIGLFVAVLSACALPAAPSTENAAPLLPAISATADVVADGFVVPAAEVELRFERSGVIAEVLVAEGEVVQPGQVLAQLDTRQLTLRVSQARVSLERAQALYNQAAAGAIPEALAVAEAGVSQAQAGFAQAQAEVSRADLLAAEAQLAEAQAGLNILLAGPKSTEATQAQATLDQARANLQQQRDALSAAKTNAELGLSQAANQVRERQQAYERIYWDNRDLERLPGDLPDERVDLEASALRAVEDAETQLAQAQVAFAQAQQAETEGVAAAEAGVRDAEARLAQLLAGPDADRIAAARARVAQAQANLDQLRGPARTSRLDAAAVGVTQAEASLAQAAAAPRAVDLAVAQAEIEAAQVALDQAELDLELAALRAPIAGTIARIDLRVGELSGPNAPAIVLADVSTWQIETSDLSELEVVRLQVGDAVRVRFDALLDLELPGTVRRINAIGENRQGDIVYTVLIDLAASDERLRWNMTAIIEAEA